MRLKYAQRYYSLEVNRELLQHFSSDSYKCVADASRRTMLPPGMFFTW
jgi:hypothetical protein